MKTVKIKPRLCVKGRSEVKVDVHRFPGYPSSNSGLLFPPIIRSNYLGTLRSVGVFGMSLLVILAAGLASPWMGFVEANLPNFQAASNGDLANRPTHKTETVFQVAAATQGRSDYHLAINHFMSSETSRAIELFDGIPEDERDLEWHLTRRQLDGGYMTLFGHKRGVKCVAFSRDGTQIITGGYDNQIKLWDGTTGAEIKTFPEQSTYIMEIGFVSNQNAIIFVDAMGATTAVDLSSGKVLWNHRNSPNGGFEKNMGRHFSQKLSLAELTANESNVH